MRRHDHLTELMDEPTVTPGDLADCLRFIRKVNVRLGGTGAILAPLQRFARHWPADATMTILDVATGSADIPEAIHAWAMQHNRRVKLLALDLHPTTLALAREWTAALPIQFLRADALRIPLADGSVDYAICSMFLHHLSHADAQQVIGEMLRVSRRGIIVNDLLRNALAKAFIHVATLFSAPIHRHDARVSVAKAWIKPEVLAWRDTLNAPWLRYHRHIFSRFTLAGERPASPAALLGRSGPE